MSDTGLYVGLYDRIRTYAELLDDVLTRLKAETSSPNDPQRQELARMLLDIAQSRPVDCASHHLCILLRALGEHQQSHWAAIGQALLADHVSFSVIVWLEHLAALLEEERVGMLSRIMKRSPT
jgi:hypothetical protein